MHSLSEPLSERPDPARGSPATGESGVSALVQASRDALSAAGPLARADAGYLEREGQLGMAAAVAEAIEARSALVVEAGTGVGNAFA